MSTRERLYDELQTERNLNAAKDELIQQYAAELEEATRLVEQAVMRVEELEAQLDSATEQKEDPHV